MNTSAPNKNSLGNYGGRLLEQITPQTQKLLDDFPRLFRPFESPFGDYGYTCGEGWFNLVYKLCADIESTATAANLDKNSDDWPLITQVKAKFAVLRLYYNLKNASEKDKELRERIDTLIKDAENKSIAICQSCGAPGTPKTNRNGWWVRVTCQTCEEKRQR